MVEQSSPGSGDQDQPSAAAGCLGPIGAAGVTGLLLFINGSLTITLLNRLEDGEVPFFHDGRLKQFLLYLVPLVLVVLQWVMIDTVRGWLRRQ